MSFLFFGSLLLFAILGHCFFWMDGVNRLHGWAGPRALIDLPTYAAVLAFVALPILVLWDCSQLDVGWTSYAWSRSGFLPRYLQFCTVWAVARLVLDQIRRRQVDSPDTLLSSKQEKSALVSPGNPLPVSGIATQVLARIPGNECLQLAVEFKRLAIPRLHPDHEGFKIAHLSDLHMTGRIDRSWFEAVVDRVNRLQADVIAITGDLLEKEACWPWLPDTLGRLRAKHGVYFILGNHDFFVDYRRTKQILCDVGLIYLTGTWIETQWNGAAVSLVGNERPWNADPLDQQSAPGRGADQLPLKIVLIHSPDQFAWSCHQDADLVLAGHTHGGQIRIPLLGAVACPSIHGTRYACGTFRSEQTVMHVSRGISGERPMRWNCPPEVALLELSAGSSQPPANRIAKIPPRAKARS